MPVSKRAELTASTEDKGAGVDPPKESPPDRPELLDFDGATTFSSEKVENAPHSGHRPIQRGL
jgi:hypothetical protein